MTFDDILAAAARGAPRRVAAVSPEDPQTLSALLEAEKRGFCQPLLIGDRQKIEAAAREAGLVLEGREIVGEGSPAAAARRAVELCRDGEADILMKGRLHSSILMKAVLDKESGIRRSKLLSMVTVLQSPYFTRLLFVTDGAMVIAPGLGEKLAIIENAVSLARRLGVSCPKVACLAAVETVNPAMPATLDASALALMSQRGQIEGCLVDGPLALDNAVSAEAARRKGVRSPVAGEADVLLVPDIEAGNILLKTARVLGGCQTAGLLMGAAVPVVMTSRADGQENKLRALACAAYQTGGGENG
ncbi:MAG: phosphate butyryltransferase [Clostridiales bacterium]|uniref:bifunctional enoyl-CoA hydratase/phosphate acetyltransferase n=1 Tax=Provencibacterium massiliense TaxID=1841868 RepID=UPI0009A707B6|nr:bifunctional enoyl-CoA hydratase/phosphate acetyltransferase [Provencibacterium massiliense]PWM38001.1 MAG: phosphate butyryltransferase [Clostridiales bacterium]RGB68255.1 bifunctional enoyl-CoA hydratase/phosphate acetyltransferase [Harryflintia acetispora]